MALPLISTLVSLGTAIALIGLLSHVLKMPEFSSQLVLLIGLGVGVDYALFIVTRHRQGLLAGRDVRIVAHHRAPHVGGAPFSSPASSSASPCWDVRPGISFLNGLAVAASIRRALHHGRVAHAAAALLGFMGPRVLSRRQRAALAATGRVSDGEPKQVGPLVRPPGAGAAGPGGRQRSR